MKPQVSLYSSPWHNHTVTNNLTISNIIETTTTSSRTSKQPNSRYNKIYLSLAWSPHQQVTAAKLLDHTRPFTLDQPCCRWHTCNACSSRVLRMPSKHANNPMISIKNNNINITITTVNVNNMTGTGPMPLCTELRLIHVMNRQSSTLLSAGICK